MSAERNDLICQLYKKGEVQSKIAEKFGITEARVGQILKRAGLKKEDRASASKRECFIGVWMTQSAKDALQKEAENEKKSVSRFISDLVVKELKQRKVDLLIRVNNLEIELPLPLEGKAL